MPASTSIFPKIRASFGLGGQVFCFPSTTVTLHRWQVPFPPQAVAILNPEFKITSKRVEPAGHSTPFPSIVMVTVDFTLDMFWPCISKNVGEQRQWDNRLYEQILLEGID